MFGLLKKAAAPAAEQLAPAPIAPRDPQHSFQLQVKTISLADEARTIRRVERKLKRAEPHFPALKETRESLRLHRKEEVASESRATALAHAFLKGKPYKTVEAKRHSDPDWKAIERMVKSYADVLDLREFEAWKAAAGKPDKR